MARKRKRSRRNPSKNPSTGATVAIAIATGTVAAVAGFWLATVGCARLMSQLPPSPGV